MKTVKKVWLGVALGVVAVVVVCWICSRNRQAKIDAMTSVLESEQALLSTLKNDPEHPYKIVDKIQQLDVSRCPTDFQKAFQKHREALSGYALMLQDLEQFNDRLKSWTTTFVNCLRTMRLDFGYRQELNAEMEAFKQKYADDIKATVNTLYEMVDIAERYGVDVGRQMNLR